MSIYNLSHLNRCIVYVTMTSILSIPVGLFKKRIRRRRLNSSAYEFPPTIDVVDNRQFGPYCVKATVETRDKNGNVDKTFIGYSQDMDITRRTGLACERYKTKGTTCQEPVMAIKSGNADEAIFMKLKNGSDLIKLTTP